MEYGAHSRGAVISDRFWISFGSLDEATYRFGRHARIDRHQNWSGSDHCDRCKVLDGVVGQLRVDARVDDVAGRHQQQRVTVRRSLGDNLGAKDATGTAPIVDHDRSTEACTQFLAEHAPNDVGTAARWVRDDEPDRSIRKASTASAATGNISAALPTRMVKSRRLIVYIED